MSSIGVTKAAKPAEVERAWHIVDATGVVLGRLAARSARILQGKSKTSYTPHVDTGDFVVVINAAKIKVTGKKLASKTYYHHSGYPGGLKERSLEDLIVSDPSEVIRLAIKRMLPKTKMGRKMIKKLKVYRGAEHPHDAQMPQVLDIKNQL